MLALRVLQQGQGTAHTLKVQNRGQKVSKDSATGLLLNGAGRLVQAAHHLVLGPRHDVGRLHLAVLALLAHDEVAGRARAPALALQPLQAAALGVGQRELGLAQLAQLGGRAEPGLEDGLDLARVKSEAAHAPEAGLYRYKKIMLSQIDSLRR